MKTPWYVWCALASVSCILIGGYWDISWHMTIGRDSFWTPAHIAIQLGGIIAGSTGAYLIFATTLGRAGLGDVSVRVWGFRGPLGAFIAVWGAAAMVISAPFDNWWHAAYGLDVKILSPPHAVLTLGILAVATGGVLLIVAPLNRAARRTRLLETLLLVVAGEVLVLGMTSILEHTFRSNLHRADAYRAIAIVGPLLVLAFGRVSSQRWATTLIAGFYMAFMVAMLWLFPRFPAEAKLGPVYQPISHFIPLEFPMLVIAPAFAIDVVRPHVDAWPRWRRALVYGSLFVLVLVIAEWPFAQFLMSEHARNWVFGTHYLPYMMHPQWYEARYEFMPDRDLVSGLVQAVIAGCLTSYLGLLLGDAMRKAKR
ncbi:MAG TPA: hypothetical protein VIV40_21070 [Kofleriaceae bacterium]